MSRSQVQSHKELLINNITQLWFGRMIKRGHLLCEQLSSWFAGTGAIDHNNGLEATNADIKQNKVLRNKQQIGSFMVNALEIVKKFSLKDNSRLFCSRADLLDLKMKLKDFSG